MNAKRSAAETETLVAVLFAILSAVEIGVKPGNEHVILETSDHLRGTAIEIDIATVMLLTTVAESFLCVRSAIRPSTRSRVARRCESLPVLCRYRYLPSLSFYSAAVIATNVGKPAMYQVDAPAVAAIFATYLFHSAFFVPFSPHHLF